MSATLTPDCFQRSLKDSVELIFRWKLTAWRTLFCSPLNLNCLPLKICSNPWCQSPLEVTQLLVLDPPIMNQSSLSIGIWEGGTYQPKHRSYINIHIYIHFKVYVYLDFRYICNQNHLKSRHLNPNNQTGFPDVKQKKTQLQSDHVHV